MNKFYEIREFFFKNMKISLGYMNIFLKYVNIFLKYMHLFTLIYVKFFATFFTYQDI